jgi:hypothetical protein
VSANAFYVEVTINETTVADEKPKQVTQLPGDVEPHNEFIGPLREVPPVQGQEALRRQRSE